MEDICRHYPRIWEGIEREAKDHTVLFRIEEPLDIADLKIDYDIALSKVRAARGSTLGDIFSDMCEYLNGSTLTPEHIRF